MRWQQLGRWLRRNDSCYLAQELHHDWSKSNYADRISSLSQTGSVCAKSLRNSILKFETKYHENNLLAISYNFQPNLISSFTVTHETSNNLKKWHRTHKHVFLQIVYNSGNDLLKIKDLDLYSNNLNNFSSTLIMKLQIKDRTIKSTMTKTFPAKFMKISS